MTEKNNIDETPSSFGSAYESVHHDADPKITASPPRMHWALPLAVVLFILGLGIVTFLVIGGRATGWSDLREMKVTSDEGYLYVLIRTAGEGEPNWERIAFALAIDTYEAKRGETRLPSPINETIASGAEFLLTLQGPGRSRLQVTPTYQPHVQGNPVFSPTEPSGSFVGLPFYPNAERFSRTGEYYPPVIIDRGVFRYGSLDPDSPLFHTLTDVGVDNGVVEIRIPWNLLNVTDPSMRRVIHSEKPRRRLPGDTEPIGTVVTRGFRLYVLSFSPASGETGALDMLPTAGRLAPLYHWPAWEAPNYKLELKHGVDQIQQTLQSIPDHPDGGSS